MESFVSVNNMMHRKIGDLSDSVDETLGKEAENGDFRAGDRLKTDRNHAGERRHAVV